MANSDNRLLIYVDGASRGNPGPAAIGIVIQGHGGSPKVEISHYIGEATNNQAEYRALIKGLEEAARLGADHVDIKTDSKLMVEQVQGHYRVRHPNLKPLFQKVTRLLSSYKTYTIAHIPRHQNAPADSLANRALDNRHAV
jgi:ribonuclease HI